MATADDLVFVPARDLATRMLAAMPQEALKLYRLLNDKQAGQLAGDVGRSVDAEALGQVVRRYLVSSVGDQAAYRLACLKLDAGDYAGARRLLTIVLADHPDPSVPRPQVLSRLALACVRCGDVQGARNALGQLAPNGAREAVRRTVDAELRARAATRPVDRR